MLSSLISFLLCLPGLRWAAILILRALTCQVPHGRTMSSSLLNICHICSRRGSTLTDQGHLTVQLIFQEQTASPNSWNDQRRNSSLGTLEELKNWDPSSWAGLAAAEVSPAKLKSILDLHPQVLWVLSLCNGMGKVAMNSKVEWLEVY